MLDPLTALSFGIPLAFLAGFIDAIAGGGGVITLPTLYFMGMPPANVVATNKLLAIFGSTSATWQYFKQGKIELPLVLRMAAFALLGSALGARLVLGFKNDDAFRLIIAVMVLLVGFLVLTNKKMGTVNEYSGLNLKNLLLAGFWGILIGLYDGFFGPGTGTFLMFVFVRFLKFDFVIGSGNARFINFITNLGAFITFLLSGKMIWMIGLPMGVANALGSYVGAKLAILKGSAFIKIIYGVIVLLVVARLLWFK